MQAIRIRAVMKAHGAANPTTFNIDPNLVKELSHRGGGEGVIKLVDGTRIPIINALDVWEQMMMDMAKES